MAGSFSYQGAYTFSKSIDNASQAGVQDNYNLRAESSLSAFDIKHNLAFGLSYELPFGKGRALLDRGGVLGAVFGGWKLGVISSARSGVPLSMGTVTNLTGSMGGNSRPNRLREAKLSGEARGRMRWFDASRFRAARTVHVRQYLRYRARFAGTRIVRLRRAAGQGIPARRRPPSSLSGPNSITR